MLNSNIFCSHSPWSGVLSSFFILNRWFYAWYILVNRVCHVIVYSFWGKSGFLLCTLVLALPFMSRNHIIYIIPHNQLLFFDHSFFHSIFFLHLELSLIPMVVFILRGGSTTLWSSFFRHGVSDPRSFRFMFIELSSLVLRNKSHPSFLLGGCTWPFLQFKCTSCMVRTTYA